MTIHNINNKRDGKIHRKRSRYLERVSLKGKQNDNRRPTYHISETSNDFRYNTDRKTYKLTILPNYVKSIFANLVSGGQLAVCSLPTPENPRAQIPSHWLFLRNVYLLLQRKTKYVKNQWSIWTIPNNPSLQIHETKRLVFSELIHLPPN